MKLKMNSEARKIYRQITRKIAEKIQLKGSLQFLEKFYPTSDREEIKKRQNYLREGFARVDKSLKPLLARIKSIRFKNEFLYDRVLIVGEDEYDKAVKLNVCRVETEPLREYPLVLSKDMGIGIVIRDLTISQIAPELYVKPLYENRQTLKTLAEIMEKTHGESIAAKILNEVEKLDEVHRRLNVIENLDEIIAEEKRSLNERIAEKIKQYSLTLSGEELLEFLSELRHGSNDILLDKFGELEKEILDEILKSESNLEDILGFSVEIFSKENIYPVEFNREALLALKQELEREIAVEFYLKSREILEKIEPLIPKLEEEFRKAYELEFMRALKEFSQEFTFPELIEGGITFINGRHLFIDDPQPISYVVGDVDVFEGIPAFRDVSGKKVVILTGANSGGKTSLLELITQIQILAQMGLPVNAEKAWVDVLDEIFLFKRKRSSYKAGAFETALRTLTRALARDSKKKLILVDEFEAITEPGAAVKILAELLKIAHEKGFYIVIVSHLGNELKEMLDFARADGIEARGLDENLNLIVDRQPKFGVIGKSTPELIVERLYRKTRGREKEIFERLHRVCSLNE